MGVTIGYFRLFSVSVRFLLVSGGDSASAGLFSALAGFFSALAGFFSALAGLFSAPAGLFSMLNASPSFSLLRPLLLHV